MWTADGDYTEPDGRTVYGTAEIQKLFALEHGSVFKKSELNLVVERVRPISDTVAIADGTYELFNAADPAGRAIGTRTGYFVNVLVKEGDTWKVSASRLMLPATLIVRRRTETSWITTTQRSDPAGGVLRPVLDPESRHSLVLGAVVRDERQIVRQGDRSDEEVPLADRSMTKLVTQHSMPFGRRAIERQNGEGGEHGRPGRALALRIGASRGAVPELGNRHGRDGYVVLASSAPIGRILPSSRSFPERETRSQ
jgi:hypothetical protein